MPVNKNTANQNNKRRKQTAHAKNKNGETIPRLEKQSHLTIKRTINPYRDDYLKYAILCAKNAKQMKELLFRRLFFRSRPILQNSHMYT